MLLRVAVYLVLGGYIVYRFTLAFQIARAKRAGDLERERQLRRRAFGLMPWLALAVVLFVVGLLLLVWTNS